MSGILAAIEARLAPLQPDALQLADESGEHIGHDGARGGGGHYRLTIVSPAFRDRTLLARHRMVYDALAPLMQREIHALAIHAYAPEEL